MAVVNKSQITSQGVANVGGGLLNPWYGLLSSFSRYDSNWSNLASNVADEIESALLVSSVKPEPVSSVWCEGMVVFVLSPSESMTITG